MYVAMNNHIDVWTDGRMDELAGGWIDGEDEDG